MERVNVQTVNTVNNERQTLNFLATSLERLLTIDMILRLAPQRFVDEIKKLTYERVLKVKEAFYQAIAAFHLKRGWEDYDEAIALSFDDFCKCLSTRGVDNEGNLRDHTMWDLFLGNPDPIEIAQRVYEIMERGAIGEWAKRVDLAKFIFKHEEVERVFFKACQSLEGLLFVLG
ncbi:MAG: hypothetical protein NZT61_07475, partial [Deltaproteobacteria bacterium]|nr:hypothetical protein [Deltaproteobacteria bacterium]